MRAAIVRGYGAPLELADVPCNEPRRGEVLVRIEATGLCHSDIFAARGEWSWNPDLPFVPGHEGIGTVEQLGPGVTEPAIGERVAVGWLGSACGVCDYCIAGREELCGSQLNPGYSIDGTMAAFARVDARYAIAVPAGIDPIEAAPLGCAGVATFAAVRLAEVGPSDLLAIFGIGGLGHLALQYGRIRGAAVAAIDLLDEKLVLARELGATHTVNASEHDPVESLLALGGATAAIVVAGSSKPFEQAYRSLRRGGRVVCVGLPAVSDDAFQLPIFDTVANGISILGSAGGTRLDLRHVLALQASGQTRVVHESRPLTEVNAAINDLLGGRINGRVVLTLDRSEAR